MRVSVVGLGYVGTVSAACLAEAGHQVTGVDNNAEKVQLLARGKSPIVEPGLDELISRNVEAGRLQVTVDLGVSVRDAEVIIICVGTPSSPTGHLDLSHVERVARDIGAVLAAQPRRPVVVALRSTVLPGTTRRVADLIRAGAPAGEVPEVAIAANPEFLREGSAVRDYLQAPYTVIGTDDAPAAAVLQRLYAQSSAPVHVVPLGVAEMIKYVSNAWHGLKVAFANEFGALCRAQGVDGHALMKLFLADTQLNVSAAYLMPGFAFGGSCLPKDLRAIGRRAVDLAVAAPVLSSVLESNHQHLERIADQILGFGRERVGLYGLTFKTGTDDLRESPSIALVRALLRRHRQVRIFDPIISLERLMGASREFVERELPYLPSLMVESPQELATTSDVIVLAHRVADLGSLSGVLTPEHVVFDLVRAVDDPRHLEARYDGLCW